MNAVKWSFSGLKDYSNCPHKYYQVKVAKQYVTPDTPQTIYGKEVHSALEDYARDGTPLPKNYEIYKPLVDPILEIPGQKYPELQLGLDKEGNSCGFDAPEYYVRGIIDLLVVSDDTAFIVDYKTGSAKYADMSQIKLMAIMTFAHFPQIHEIKGALLFLAKPIFLTNQYTRDDIPVLWQAFAPTVARLTQSFETDHWPKNPTPLCGWCPVKECEFWRNRT